MERITADFVVEGVAFRAIFRPFDFHEARKLNFSNAVPALSDTEYVAFPPILPTDEVAKSQDVRILAASCTSVVATVIAFLLRHDLWAVVDVILFGVAPGGLWLATETQNKRTLRRLKKP